MTTIDPGDGYLLLDVGAIQEAPDEFFSRRSQSWKPVYNVGLPVKRGEYVRRRETTITTSGPYIAIEVHREEVQRLESHITELLGQLEDGYRDAKEQQAEIERLKAELDERCEIWRIARDIAANERDAAESEVKRLKAELEAVKQPQPSSKPQPGEFWVVGNGERVRIIGWSSNGRLYVEYECGTVINRKPEATDDWNHLPHCTGWGWQPEPEPEWFDLTPFVEHVLRRDVDWVVYTYSEKWQIVGISRGAKIGQVRGYIAKARCLLKDAPPELVAKASKPAEDPDEWVTQDRDYKRPCDQRRWVDVNSGRVLHDWDHCYMVGHHGYTQGNMRLELRCRRRDLPPMSENPKTEREVSLYWYDGNVVGRYADCPPDDPSFVPLIFRDGKVFVEIETQEVVR